MKLRTKLKIILIISLATVLLVSLSFGLATWRIHEARQKQEISQKIIKNFFDLNTVVYDYLLYHEERPQIQWQKKNETLTGVLAALESQDPEEKAVLEKIRRDHQSMKVIFSQLIAAYENRLGADPRQQKLLREMEERLTLQLMTKSREIALYAAKLEEKSRAQETNTEKIYDGFIYIALLILGLTMAANSYLMVRGVVKPIVQLHQGTEIIGAGDLDHKVGTDASCEIGQLSRAFDQMTEKLKVMTNELRLSERECRLLATQLLAAEEKERNRIAQELHDGVGQMLSAVKYRLEHHLEQKMELPLAERRESLRPAIPLLQESVEEIRRICMALRPSLLDDLGILATVNWFCREFQKIYPHILIVQETAVKEEEIPPAVKTTIFRTFQEAFNNAAKHSRASRVCIALRKSGEMLELIVEDDGQGFDIEAHRSQENHRRGIGLGSMKERVELSGGIFTLESAPGRGTFVRAVWPLEVAAEEDFAVRG